MAMPYILADQEGDNSVDSVTRKVDEHGAIYYEVNGKNSNKEQRTLRIYAENVTKPYVIVSGSLVEARKSGTVHQQILIHLSKIVNHFEIPEPLDFITPVTVAPYTIHDVGGDNYVDSVTRKLDETGHVYYEVKGRNDSGQERTVYIYDNGVIQPYIHVGGEKVAAGQMGRVHQQITSNLTLILQHFSISTPLNFTNSALIQKPEVVIPKKPPAIIQSTVVEELPSRSFFIQAAQRALEVGDVVAAKQKKVHHTRQEIIGIGSKYYDEGNSTRLNLFHELVAGSKDGYYPFAATTAYGLSLLTYIATNYDTFSKDELQSLYQIYKSVAGDIPAIGLDPSSPEYRLALAQSLKAEVNEVTVLRERLSYGQSVTDPLSEYTRDLVRGNIQGRPVIDKQTGISVSSGAENSLTRTIPGFFPIPPDTGTTDQIVLQGGGCRTHSAIVCIWKQGVDKEGEPVIPGDGKTIERYKVYRTVCNAGFGTTYDVRINPPALYHEIFSPKSDGQTYSVCTQEVLLPVGVSYSDERMQKQIEDLVDAERSLLLFYDLPGIKGPNNEVGTLDQVEQAEWRRINQSVPLGPVEITHSVLRPPQDTGNCTVRSIEEYLRWDLIRKGVSQKDAAKVLDGHWDFASHNDSASIVNKLSDLALPKPSMIIPEQSLVETMNLVTVKSFFSNPVAPKFPEYSPDTASQEETNKLVREIRSGTKDCPKPTMMFIGELLAEVSNTQQSTSQTKAGYYLLQGCDARIVPAFACMQGSVRQVASQFNNGESMGRYETSPNKFKMDHTQGPAEQRTTGGAAIARYAHSMDSDCFGVLLSDPAIKLEFNQLFDYQYGYLTPKAGQERKGLEFLKKHINHLALNVERVTIDGAPGQSAIQVLNAGLALGGYDLYQRSPQNRKYLNEMSELLFTAQYKAVSAVAVLEAQNNPDKRIPVSFTMVGGGVFGNDKTAIAKAVSQAIKLVKDSGVHNIDIYLSIYNSYEIAEYQQLVANGDEFAELRVLLNQMPITQSQLQSLHTLPTPQKTEVEKADVINPDLETLIVKSEHQESYVDNGIVEAMRAAINALSTKSHLSREGGVKKANLLEGHLKAYRDSQDPVSAKKAILQFMIAASTQRQSKWGSLFTSKFGETSSTKAFFDNINNDKLKSKVLAATEIVNKSGSEKTIEFKEFANQFRQKYEVKEESSTDKLKP